MFCCYNKSTKCEKLGKYLSYCTRNRVITDDYWLCVTCVYTDHIISLLIKSVRFTMFTRSMKRAMHKISVDMALVTVKVVRKKNA